MGIEIVSKGDLKKTEAWLLRLQKIDIRPILERGAETGVAALVANTPEDSGLAANSWGYEIDSNPYGSRITWLNSDNENGFPVAIMLQYGYGTGTGGYVQGRDYINPAMRPIFDQIAAEVWKAVTSA